MPAFIQRFRPAGIMIEEGWAFPTQLEHTTIIDPATKIGELLVFFCRLSHTCTNVYSRAIEQEELDEKQSEFTQGELMAVVRMKDSHRVQIDRRKPEILQAGKEATGIDAIKVHHFEHVSRDRLMPRSFRLPPLAEIAKNNSSGK